MIHSTGIEISANINKIPVLINFTGSSMLKFGLNDYEQLHVQLAVEEAVTNIIKHESLQKSGKISIRYLKSETEIKIIIEYLGESFNPIDASKSELKSLKQKPTVYRAHFLKKYMNKIDYCFNDGKNILTLIKRI